MPIGLTILVIVSILVFFGVAHRILDRLRLSDKAALLFLGAFIIGSLIPNIPITRNFSINIGGFIVPFILVIYLFVKADTVKEKVRSIIASIMAGAAIFLTGRFVLPDEPEMIFMEPIYIYGILGGLIAYLFGRSRRAAFMAGMLGIALADITQSIINNVTGVRGVLMLGGAGVLDATVISAFIALLLAEILGETREKLQGGTNKKDAHFENAEFTSMLGDVKDNGNIRPFKKKEDRGDNGEE